MKGQSVLPSVYQVRNAVGQNYYNQCVWRCFKFECIKNIAVLFFVLVENLGATKQDYKQTRHPSSPNPLTRGAETF